MITCSFITGLNLYKAEGCSSVIAILAVQDLVVSPQLCRSIFDTVCSKKYNGYVCPLGEMGRFI